MSEEQADALYRWLRFLDIQAEVHGDEGGRWDVRFWAQKSDDCFELVVARVPPFKADKG